MPGKNHHIQLELASLSHTDQVMSGLLFPPLYIYKHNPSPFSPTSNQSLPYLTLSERENQPSAMAMQHKTSILFVLLALSGFLLSLTVVVADESEDPELTKCLEECHSLPHYDIGMQKKCEDNCKQQYPPRKGHQGESQDREDPEQRFCLLLELLFSLVTDMVVFFLVHRIVCNLIAKKVK
jgi:hypothetical protein